MGKADFRVNKKIFATLDDGKNLGTVKLQPHQQLLLLETHPKAFFPANGFWGERGWTKIHLQEIDEKSLRHGLELAWSGIASKKLLAEFESDSGS